MKNRGHESNELAGAGEARNAATFLPPGRNVYRDIGHVVGFHSHCYWSRNKEDQHLHSFIQQMRSILNILGSDNQLPVQK